MFARVAEGIAVAQKISMVTATGGVPAERIVIRTVSIREKPAPVPEPFSTETCVRPGAVASARRDVARQPDAGDVPRQGAESRPAVSPAGLGGAYDGTAFHRIVRGFVVQGGYMPTRTTPLDERQQGFVRKLMPEFNDTPHELGTLSMARGDDPGSADTSFFIVLDRSTALDGKYTAFGRVVGGLDVLEKIAGVALDGETPRTRVGVTRVTVTKN